MATDGTPSPEREQTDESLRTEREKADGGQVERQAAREQVADRVIRKAREQADAILVAAREKADRQLEETERSVESVSDIATVVEGRVLEDEALRHERASADEVVRREREERARALSRLLPLKRDKTDLHLLTERARSDDALSHRDDFLGIVSHDLRNLLSGIVLSAGVLARDAPEGEEGDRIAEGTASILRHSQASESLPASTERFIRRVCRTSPSDRGRRTLSP